MWFTLPDSLLAALRGRREAAHRAEAPAQREVEDLYDAFLLDSGNGPTLYLTADGRVLADDRWWDGTDLREIDTENEAIATIVIAAARTGFTALLELLPPCPGEGAPCPMCRGTRFARLRGTEGETVCFLCFGRAWVVPSLLDAARAAGIWPPPPGSEQGR